MCSEITIKTKIMNDTRKQIIEIIEPCMDKALSEGCLVKIGHKYSYIYSKYDALLDRSPTTPYLEKSIWNIKHSIGNNYELCVFDQQKNKDGSYNILSTKDTFKILGHYDTTALLKYIDETGFGHIFTQKEIFTDEIRVFTEDQYEGGKVTEFGDNLGWLPCKPLHLYTPQEDKDLLTLLQKIGN